MNIAICLFCTLLLHVLCAGANLPTKWRPVRLAAEGCSADTESSIPDVKKTERDRAEFHTHYLLIILNMLSKGACFGSPYAKYSYLEEGH
ncbi:hypothetical protein scyTo_0007721 [Scyliorhinus torazame]|uniref:Secreted protein n=1 Tax=Scyliorhinus torazame TaxID=75743 RepID=A0A401NX74_SCYTO|nr:hypothetical protein [Scyliorhinus torazame]